VLFDKTGTLTKGAHAVTGLASTSGDDDELLALAAAVEADSEHPLARAVVTAAAHLAVPSASGFRSIPGRGVEARVDGSTVAVGGPALLREHGLEEPESLAPHTEAWRGRGAAVLNVVRDGAIVGGLALEDEIRPESKAAVDELHRLGVRVVMITGDARQVADAVAAEIGVDEVFAEVLPEDKDHAVSELQSRGLSVAMVGDGVNDAPALARADIGIAIGAGTDVAIETAKVVLMKSDPLDVTRAVVLSKATVRKMKQNLVWASVYNVLAIPVAAGVLYPAYSIMLRPEWSALLMSVSSIIVAVNAVLLKGVEDDL
jgi:P-type Cu2+ transporter